MKPSPEVHLLVLTEDSGDDAFDTLRSLAKEMFQLLVPAVQTQHLKWEPLEPPEARQAMRANFWRDRTGRFHRQVVVLGRTIATQLALENGFVLFHYDGDLKWSARPTDKDALFDELIVAPVRMHLAGRSGVDPKRIDESLAKLLRMVPYYSVEAWLLQNTRESKRLCLEHHHGAHTDALTRLATPRSELDELDKPKESSCLGGRFNRELAFTSFPAIEAYDTAQSFAATVDQLLGCGPLLEALQQTVRTP